MCAAISAKVQQPESPVARTQSRGGDGHHRLAPVQAPVLQSPNTLLGMGLGNRWPFWRLG